MIAINRNAKTEFLSIHQVDSAKGGQTTKQIKLFFRGVF